MGFVKDKSIVDNANVHVGANYVYNIDLKDFFYSFDRNRVKMGLWFYLFNMDKQKESLAFLLSSLCTHPIEIEGKINYVLPQGSPTSPTITNILCFDLDRRLNGLAKRFGAKYTRYADDITFSSSHNIYNNDDFQQELRRLIEENQKLVIQEKKVRLQKRGYKQEVTGLIVNEKVNVSQSYIKNLRMWIYYLEKYGVEKTQKIFKKSTHEIKKGTTIEQVVLGKLNFLKMVKGSNDSTYLKLKERMDKLFSVSRDG